MLTTRWKAVDTMWPRMNRLQEEMEQSFGRGAGMNDPRRFAHSVYPPLNAWEDDSNLYVEAELPELELTDLEIIVNGNTNCRSKVSAGSPSVKTAGGTARSEAMATSRGRASCRSTWTVTRSRPNSNTVC